MVTAAPRILSSTAWIVLPQLAIFTEYWALRAPIRKLASNFVADSGGAGTRNWSHGRPDASSTAGSAAVAGAS